MIVETQMRTAFVRAAIRAANAHKVGQRSVISRIADNADIGVGKRPVKDWNAHLSFRTHERLVVQGIMDKGNRPAMGVQA